MGETLAVILRYLFAMWRQLLVEIPEAVHQPHADHIHI